MAGGVVQRLEVVEIVFDLGSGFDRKTHRAEDPFQIAADLGHRVKRAPRRASCGKRDVDAVACERRCAQPGGDGRLGVGDRGLEVGLHRMDRLARGRASDSASPLSPLRSAVSSPSFRGNARERLPPRRGFPPPRALDRTRASSVEPVLHVRGTLPARRKGRRSARPWRSGRTPRGRAPRGPRGSCDRASRRRSSVSGSGPSTTSRAGARPR